MKLMTYNIFNGGGPRLSSALNAIKQEAPHFLTINEANTFTANSNKLLKEIADEISLPNYEIALSGEHDYHVAVFSKYSFNKIYKPKSLMRACVLVEVDTEFGLLSIASAHLNPYTEDSRLSEIDLVINAQKQCERRILMGDMNSLSQIDTYSPKITADFNEPLLKQFTTGGKLRYDVIKKILSSGYYDCASLLKRQKDHTTPTLISEYSNHPKMRLDYVFLSQPLLPYLTNYSVIKNDFTNKASDHYPVVAMLE